MKNFEARNGNSETNAVVKNQETKQRAQRTLGEVGSGKPTGSVLKETIAVSDTISISVQKRHSRILLRVLLRGRMREMHRDSEVLEAKAQVEECFRLPCKYYLKGTCTNSFCEKWHP